MSTPPPQIPAGWYQDPEGSGLLRWWDGTAWTDHRAGTALAPAKPTRPAIAADARVDTVWSWLVALLPLVSVATLLAFDMRGYIHAVAAADPRAMLMSLSSYLYLIPLTWIAYGLVVFFAYRDWRSLNRAGVVRPFHWAFAFIGSLVYLIGRTVILRKVSSRGGIGPLVVAVMVYLVVLIVAFYWSYLAFADIVRTIPRHYDPRF